MGLEEVRQDMLRRVAAEEAAIEREGKEEAERLLREARQQAESMKKAAEEEVGQTIAAMRRQELSFASLQAKRALLNLKKEILDELYEKAAKKLAALGAKERSALLKALIARGKSETDAVRVYSNQHDKEIAVAASGLEWKQADRIGGVMLESADGSVRINYSFEQLLEEARQRAHKKLAKELFGND